MVAADSRAVAATRVFDRRRARGGALAAFDAAIRKTDDDGEGRFGSPVVLLGLRASSLVCAREKTNAAVMGEVETRDLNVSGRMSAGGCVARERGRERRGTTAAAQPSPSVCGGGGSPPAPLRPQPKKKKLSRPFYTCCVESQEGGARAVLGRYLRRLWPKTQTRTSTQLALTGGRTIA